ncbi:hypothetical protein BDN67DRAFT_813626 [Paxillus ammoniavirescens]|nr:hypothetical protein BDN67DRAFT_813626 [Paxillus ammoniavirescens]
MYHRNERRGSCIHSITSDKIVCPMVVTKLMCLPRAAQQRNHTTLSHLSPSRDTPPLKSSRSLSSLVHRTRGVPRRYTETVVATKQLLVLLPSAKTSPVSRHDDSTASRIIATSTHPLQLEHATMDSASTDATLVVDLGVGASTGTPTLASGRDVPRSPASPPSNVPTKSPYLPRTPISLTRGGMRSLKLREKGRTNVL